MTVFAFLMGFPPLGVVALSRCWFLAPTPLGWGFYLANVAWETVEKRTPFSRGVVEAVVALGGLVIWWVGGVPFAVMAGTGAGLAALELAYRSMERRMLTDTPLYLNERGLRGGCSGRPGPCVDPDLTLRVNGPLVSRFPHPDLGSLTAGRPIRLGVSVGNHSPAPTQGSVRVSLELPAGWEEMAPCSRDRLRPSEVMDAEWEVVPREGSGGVIRMMVEWGDVRRDVTVSFESVKSRSVGEVREAGISEWPGGRRAAFAWRGDMDLVDSSSFQTWEGLQPPLRLGSRYRIAQSMYLSTRLSLDEKAARAWAAHYDVDRDAGTIPEFVEGVRREVNLVHRNPYPADLAGRRFSMEIGNHGHLHYDTDASGDPGNGWRAGVKAGEGSYPWCETGGDSLTEQRDNIREASRWIEEALDYRPRSWAKPGRGNDAYTPAAVEAAGMEVATGSDIRARDNVLRQPPPHHPGGTGLVELTARYPSDPRHGFHAWMLVFWLYRAWRRGIPMVYMCHQHLRQFEGHACERITEFLLRRAVSDSHGDFHIDTVTGLGRYWLDVLNPKTRTVEVFRGEEGVRVRNRSGEDYTELPVRVEWADGSVSVYLVSVLAGEETRIEFTTPSSEESLKCP